NFRFPFQMARIGSIENLKRLGRINGRARNRSRCHPEFFRLRNVNHTVGRHGMIALSRKTFAAVESLRVNHAKRRVPTVADVNHAVANAGRGWSDRYLATTPFDFAGLE